MSRTCRLCGAHPGRYRMVSVGDGLTRRWAICDRCLDALEEAAGVTVRRAGDSDRVVLRVDPGVLAGSEWRDAW